MVVLMGRLFYLQIENNEYFSTKSLENRIKIEPLVPTRGLIFSRNGKLIAGNNASLSLVAIPEKIADMEASLSRLAEKLGLEEAELKRSLVSSKGKKFDKHVLKAKLTEKEAAIFAANRFHFPGISVIPNSLRHYPLGPEMAHVLGYVGRIHSEELKHIDVANYRGTRFIGKTGIEKSLEPLLHGISGYRRVEVNAEGRVIRTVERRGPIPGENLYLTIDSDLQLEAFKALNGKVGSVVAIDPNNGEVLVAASSPSFDPNLFVNGISQKQYENLIYSKDRRLFNRFLQGQYPPGSTIKPIIALGALEAGIKRHDVSVFCPGFFRLSEHGRPYRCWAKKGHGNVNMAGSIARSCDVYYYSLAQEFGIQGLHDSLIKFGLGEKTGVNLPGEKAGLVPSVRWKKKTLGKSWYPGETLISGIGQGFMLATPMQLAHVTSILASRGEVKVPHFFRKSTHDFLNEVNSYQSEETTIVLKEQSNWDLVHDAMVQVVHGKSGTARSSKLANGIIFAGKSGTAQVSSVDHDIELEPDEIPVHLRDHSLFIGYAPAENPTIAIAVVVENGGSGSRVAAPIAKRVIDKFFVRQSKMLTSYKK
jgi:penicillin-binding protein 2